LLHVSLADAAALPYPSDRFDTVFSTSVFHFIREPQRAIHEMYRALKPDGQLILTDWCRRYRSIRMLDFLLKYIDPAHYRCYNLDECIKMLSDTGFSINRDDCYKISTIWGMMTIIGRKRQTELIMSTQCCTQCGKPVKQNSRFCPQCGALVQEIYVSGASKTENRKPETRNHTGMNKKVIIGLFAAVIGILLLLVFQFITYEEHSVIAQQPVISEPVNYSGEPLGMTEVDATQRDGYFVIFLDDVKNNNFVRTWYDAATARLPVVAYISSKGRLVTAIGITEPCGESNYTIIDNHIHCSTCTGEWDLNSMQAFGSCPKYFPYPIPSTVSGSEVLIATADLDNWRRRW
jgi:hypothetical protein